MHDMRKMKSVMIVTSLLLAGAAAAQDVMVNPYDAINAIQAQKNNEAQAVKMRIAGLVPYARKDDAAADEMAAHLSRILSAPPVIDSAAASHIINLGQAVIEVDRISTDDSQRDWMVPSLSMIQQGDTSIGKPQDLFLDGWELTRGAQGETIVGRMNDPLSRIPVRVGMVLGEYGRIMAVSDTMDGYFLILEGGQRISGAPKRS